MPESGQMRTRYFRLSIEGLWICSGYAVGLFSGLLCVKLLTKVMSPEDYGSLGLLLVVLGMINQLLFGPLTNAAARFYSVAERQNQQEIYFSCCYVLIRRCCIATFSMGSLYLFVGPLMHDSVGSLSSVAIALFYACVSGISALILGIKNAARERKAVATYQGGEGCLRYLIFFMFALWQDSFSVQEVTFGYALAALILLCFQLYIERSRLPPRPMNKSKTLDTWIRNLWNYAWPIGLWGIFSGVHLASDRWALNIFGTSESIGFYVVLFQLGFSPAMVFITLISQFLSPIIFNRTGDSLDVQKNRDVARLTIKLVLILLGITFLVTGMVWCLSERIFTFMVPEQYQGIAYLLPILTCAGGVFATGQLLAISLMSIRGSWVLMWIKICTAVIGVVLNALGAYSLQIAGVVYANLFIAIIYLSLLIIVFVFVYKSIKRDSTIMSTNLG